MPCVADRLRSFLRLSNRLSTSCRSIAKQNPRWGVIARTFNPADFTIDTRIYKALCGFRVQEQMIDAETSIAFPPVSSVVPKSVHRRIGMHGADGINPTLIKNPPK